MKTKYIILSLLVILSIGFAFAANEEMGAKDGTGEFHDEIVATGGQNGSGVAAKTSYGGPQARIQGEGQLMLQNGETLRFNQQNGEMKLQAGETMANCMNCNLSESEGQLRATLSNGRNAEIKIMPNVASEVALQRLRLVNCPEETCKIELKEVGQGNETKMAYQLETKTQARFLGMFKVKANVQAQVNAETGEVIETKKPWWATIVPETTE